MGCFRNNMRTQELWQLTVSPSVLSRASSKLLYRMGFYSFPNVGTIEGHGLGSSGRRGDPFSDISAFRKAIDEGRYLRIGQLGPGSSEEDLRAPYTYRDTASGKRSIAKAEKKQFCPQERIEAIKASMGDVSYAKRFTGNVGIGGEGTFKTGAAKL